MENENIINKIALSIGVFISLMLIPKMIEFAIWTLEQPAYVAPAIISINFLALMILTPFALKKFSN